MAWYSLLKFSSKFFNSQCCICGICNANLVVSAITENPHHHYTIGQLYKCPCGKSVTWTNSIRNDTALLAFIKKEVNPDTGRKQDSYYQGFCNDLFCGICYNYVQPIQNGFMYNGKSFDLWGCSKCENKHLIMDGFKKWPENESSKLIEWYSSMLPSWQNLVQPNYPAVKNVDTSK